MTRRIRALLHVAAGMAALPLVGPVVAALRSELDAALEANRALEEEADSQRDRADTLAARSANVARKERDDAAIGHAATVAKLADESIAAVTRERVNLRAMTDERDELNQRLAAVTGRCRFRTCGKPTAPGLITCAAHAFTGEDTSPIDAEPAESDPVCDWPQPGVSEADACDYCGKPHHGAGGVSSTFYGSIGSGYGLPLCAKCVSFHGPTPAEIRTRHVARKALRSSGLAP